VSDEQGEDDFGIDIPEPMSAIPDGDYGHQARPRRTTFGAWHKPRKQHIREAQWANALNSALQGRDPDDRLKYIGLPGIDLLDIRHFLTAVCEPANRKIEFVGFDLAANSGGESATHLNLSNSELALHRLVHPSSLIRPDDVRVVGSQNSAAWRAVRRMGPVDVVNLDLTNHVLSDEPGAALSYLGALREIVNLQAGNPRDWVLFLTTRIDRESASSATVDALVEHLNAVLADCDDLSTELTSAIGVVDNLRLEQLGQREYSVLTLTAFMRWIYQISMGGNVRSRPNVTSCFYYTSFDAGGDGSPDVASLVIRFRRVFAPVADGVFDLAGSEVETSECADLSGFARRFAGARDLDLVLREDASLQAELVERSADLLEKARFDRAAYKRWVTAGAS
jgi:hypothetical protein